MYCTHHLPTTTLPTTLSVFERQKEKDGSSTRILRERRQIKKSKRSNEEKKRSERKKAGKKRIQIQEQAKKQRRQEETEARERRSRMIRQEEARKRIRLQKERNRVRTNAYNRMAQRKEETTRILLAKIEKSQKDIKARDQRRKMDVNIQKKKKRKRIRYKPKKVVIENPFVVIERLVSLQKRQLFVIVEEEEEAENQRVFLMQGVEMDQKKRASKHHEQQRINAIARIRNLTMDHRTAFLNKCQQVGVTEWEWRRNALESAGSTVNGNRNGNRNGLDC